MAASLGVRTATYILGSIAALYVSVTVLLLLCVCCLCCKKRKARAVSPRAGYLSPRMSVSELEAGSSVTTSARTSTTDLSTNSTQQLPNRYRRSKVKRRTEAIATCPEFEGARDSPVFKRGQAWSREKNSPSSPETYSIPRTPDSGLAPSLKDSKCSEPIPGTDQATRSCTPSSLQSSSKGSSSSNGENDDVFDEKATEAETSSTRQSADRRPPKPKAARTESTTPLMNDDEDLCSPSNEKKFDLPPIKERNMSSPTSQDGSFFVNKSALDHDEEEEDRSRPRSTELKKQPLRELPLLKRVPSSSVGSTPMESGPNSLRARGDLLLPLSPPAHYQESCSNDEDKDEQTTAL